MAENFTNGSGVTTDSEGLLHGVSVNSAPGRTVEELSRGIPNNQIGVSTVGRIRQAGGDVIPKPTVGARPNPYHCEMCGITAKRASELFTPTRRHPHK